MDTSSLPHQSRRRNRNEGLSAGDIVALLNAVDNVRDNVMIRLGLSVGLRVSEVCALTPGDVDYQRGVVRIWDEKKDVWREVMPDLATLAALRQYANSLAGRERYLFPISARTAERIIQRVSRRALGRTLSWHSLRTTYVSRSVEQNVPMSIVMANTGNSAETVLRYYTRLPESVVRQAIERAPVIPNQS